jgi:pseudaminic acid cytidylyltransferase
VNIAIIPARGGSKRIPLKNIKIFDGKPLIAYSIDAAKASGLFDKIIVSTDSEEIAEVAKAYGADVPFIRPQELSNDVVGTRPVTNHGINFCIDHFYKPKFCCCIYATAPFLQAKFLKQGLDSLEQQSEKSFAFSVTSFPFPVQRALLKTQAGVTPMFPDDIGKRSQDLEEGYHDAGQFYWGTADAYLSTRKIFSEHSLPVVLPRHLVQDIDTPEDWQRAELMFQAYVQGQHSE